MLQKPAPFVPSVVVYSTCLLLGIQISLHGQPGTRCAGEAAGKVGCLLPNVVGSALQSAGIPDRLLPSADIGAGNSIIVGQFTSAIPLPSPASGFTYMFDRAAGVYTRSTESFGPTLAERAETIGRNRVSLGFAFQRFTFDKVDGISLNNAPFAIETPLGRLDQLFDVRIRLTQYNFFASYGVTNRLDVSVGVPLNHIRIAVGFQGTVSNSVLPLPPGGLNLRGSETRSASGLGDITLQVKQTVVKGERAGVALGLAVRTPTGDEENILGSGALGVRPFLAASYSYRHFAPHANLSYEWNGKSTLMGNILTGEERRLPRQFVYIVGFDSALHNRVTFNFDVIGRRLFGVDLFRERRRGSLNVTTGVAGFKVNVGGNLLLGAHVLFRLDEGGLHHKPAPLFTLSYTL